MSLANFCIPAVARSSLSSESPVNGSGTEPQLFEYCLLSTAILVNQYSLGSMPNDGSSNRAIDPGKLS
jgi:hypothetical protein